MKALLYTLLPLILGLSTLNPTHASCNDHAGKKSKATQKEQTEFGETKITKGATHQIAELADGKQNEKILGEYVRIQGKVKDVCPMRGCWIEVADVKTGKQIKVKVKDGEIVFPKGIVGKDVIVEGKLEARHLNKKAATRYMKHLAEEKGQKFDPKTVKGPMTVYMLRGTAAKVIN